MSSYDLLDNNVLFGPDSLLSLKKIIDENKYKRILLITGNTSFTLSGAQKYFDTLKKDYKYSHYSYSGKLLSIEDIDRIYSQIMKINDIDFIIGLGGGTILDLTKIISILFTNKIKDVNEILVRNDLTNNIDLCLVPTTAGSGSESTNFSVVYKEKIKYSVVSNNLGINKIILDSNLLRKLPIEIHKISILDALSQAIESIWSTTATDLSIEFATAALKILYENLFLINSLKEFDSFLIASHLAGKAINISKTTAAHAISYPLTAYYNIPHGLAVFLTLNELINYNFAGLNKLNNILYKTKLIKSFEEYFKIFECDSIVEFSEKINSIFERFQFNNLLKSYSIKKEELEFISSIAINSGRLDNNPCKVEKNDIMKMLINIFE